MTERPSQPNQDTIAAAKASYDRCCRSRDFIPAFYANFFRACPEAQPMFAKTDFSRQHKLLRHALGLLLNFPGHSGAEPNLLTRIAERHGRGDLDVAPRLYPAFVDAMIQTIGEYDPQFTPALESAWRKSVAPGIAYLQSKY